MSMTYDWTKHIEGLEDFPSLSTIWEKEMVKEMSPVLKSLHRPRVLEIGCSNGRWLRWFEREFGAETVGVDINPAGSSSVKNFVQADGLALPFSDSSFDIVFSFGLIEHLPTVQLRHRLIREHVRVARKDHGIVVLEHPNMNISLDRLYIKIYYDRLQGTKHYRITAGESVRGFRSCGMEILRRRWIGWTPPAIVHLMNLAFHKIFSSIPPLPEKCCERKLFTHSLTAESFLIIGRRR